MGVLIEGRRGSNSAGEDCEKLLEMTYLISVLIEVKRGEDVSWRLHHMGAPVDGMGVVWVGWLSRDVA